MTSTRITFLSHKQSRALNALCSVEEEKAERKPSISNLQCVQREFTPFLDRNHFFTLLTIPQQCTNPSVSTKPTAHVGDSHVVPSMRNPKPLIRASGVLPRKRDLAVIQGALFPMSLGYIMGVGTLHSCSMRDATSMEKRARQEQRFGFTSDFINTS